MSTKNNFVDLDFESLVSSTEQSIKTQNKTQTKSKKKSPTNKTKKSQVSTKSRKQKGENLPKLNLNAVTAVVTKSLPGKFLIEIEYAEKPSIQKNITDNFKSVNASLLKTARMILDQYE